MGRRAVAVAVLASMLCLVLPSFAAGAPASLPDTLVVRRDNPLKKRVPYLPDPVTVRDAVLVRALYARIRNLPPFPSGVLNCPAGSGVSYDLNFLAGSSMRLTAVADDPAGCGEVNVGSEHLLGDTAFWLVLGAALRLAPGELDGFAELNGPAPPAPPSTGGPPPNAEGDRVVLTLTTGSTLAEEDGLPVTLPAAPGPDDMVPLRFVAEAFGASLVWHPKSRTAAVSLGASTLTLRVGSGTATVGSGALTLTEAPLLSHGVMLAPAAALARAFGGRLAPGGASGSLVLSGPPDPTLYRAESVLASLPPLPGSTPAAPPSQPLYPCLAPSSYWRWGVGPSSQAAMRLSDVWTWSRQALSVLGYGLICNGNESGTNPYNWADTEIFERPRELGPQIALQVEPGHGGVVWRYAVASLAQPTRPPDERVPASATRVEVEVDQGDQVLARLVSSDAALAGRLAGELNALRVQPLTAEQLQSNYPCSTPFRFRVTLSAGAQVARFTQAVGCGELIAFDRPGGDAQYPPLESSEGLSKLAYDLLRAGSH